MVIILKPHRHRVRRIVSVGLIQFVLSALTALPQEFVPPVLERHESSSERLGRDASPYLGTNSSPYLLAVTTSGASRQVNVNGSGANVVGDAANEPSLCIDP